MVFLLTCRNCSPWIFLSYLPVTVSVLFHYLAKSSRWESRNSIPKWEMVSYHDRGLTAAGTKGAEEAEEQQQWEPYYLVELRQNQPWPLPSVKGGWAALVCARPHDIFIGEALPHSPGHCRSLPTGVWDFLGCPRGICGQWDICYGMSSRGLWQRVRLIMGIIKGRLRSENREEPR